MDIHEELELFGEFKHSHGLGGLKELSSEGEFVATIAKLNSIDLDRDVTLPGAFPEGSEVHIAAWGHNWDVPSVGTAVIHSTPEEVQAHGRFNLAMASGRDHYEAVKQARAIQEWSYGFFVQKSSYGQFDGQDVRFLEQLDVAEVSPVMRGAAGRGVTRVEAIKARGALIPFADQAESALGALTDFVARAKAIVELRESKGGRVLSAANEERMRLARAGLADAIDSVDALLAQLVREADEAGGDEESGKAIDAASLLIQYEALMSRTKAFA